MDFILNRYLERDFANFLIFFLAIDLHSNFYVIFPHNFPNNDAPFKRHWSIFFDKKDKIFTSRLLAN